MSDDAAIRRANLRALKLDPNQLKAKAGRTYSYWRDLLESDKKSFGEKVARSMEPDLGLPRGWLDQDHTTPLAPSLPAPRPASAQQVPPTLEAALPVVLEALGAIPALRWPAVQATLAQMVGQPEMRDDLAAELLPLLQPAAAKQRPAA